MFFIILIFIFFLVVATLVLPVLNGLGSYKIQVQPKQPTRMINKPHSQQRGYIPPDELAAMEEQAKKDNSKLQRLKNGLMVTKEDMPLKFKLSDDSNSASNMRRRKVQTLEEINDPSAFDYDLDEFNEDSDEEVERRDWNERASKGEQYLEEIA